MSENVPALFSNPGMAVMAASDAASIARATQEIQAALVIGMNNPRDEIRAEQRIMQACKRKALAEVAEYEYSRGGTKITGPTIDLLRAIANRWGNLLFGWTEVERKHGQSQVRCWAWDTQYNSRAERTFMVRHWRDTQGGGYELKDERDIYELISNQASRRVRACLEEVIDSDIVQKAVDTCRRTLREGEKEPLKDRVIAMVNAFAEFAVTGTMIERRLGNKLDAVSENQLASLRRVFLSLRDGVGVREDYFKADVAEPDMPSKTPQDVSGGMDTPSLGKRKRQPKAEASAVPSGASPGATEPPAASQPVSQPETKAEPEPFNPVKALRGLAKESKIAEGKILEFLAEVGSTNGDVATLEDLALSYPQVIKLVVDQWSDVSGRVQSGN